MKNESQALCDNKRKSGFTLIEIMVVIGIMALLAGMLLGGLSAAKKKAKKTQARSEIDQIVTAWKAYYSDYRHFPDVGAGKSYKNLTEMGVDAVRIIQGNYSGDDGDEWGKKNPRKTKYLDFHPRFTDQPLDPKWTDKKMGMHDPWGNLYKIALDQSPYDGVVDADGESGLQYSVVAWWMKRRMIYAVGISVDF